MGRLSLLVLLSSLHYIAETRNVYSDLIGKSHFTETSLNRYLDNLAKLNNIQSKLLGVEAPSNDDASRDLLIEATPAKPDQLPYLFEGDIILTEEQMSIIIRNAEDQLWAAHGLFPRARRSMTSNLQVRWTKFPIPYYINTGTGVSVSAVQAGVARWQQDTCITFQQQSSLPRGNGLEFILGSGCYSYIGRSGSSSQQVSIGNGCTSLGTVTHEIGHALGFYHEQARYDRDDYVTILTQNIQSQYLSQFTKQSRSSMVDYGVGYDYGSVMHYDQTSFTANGGNTIQTNDANYQATIGQRLAPSFADVKRINLAYCNSTCPRQLACFNGGYTDPKDCNNCRCPDGLGGQLCERAANSIAACGWGDVTATNTLQTIKMSGAGACSYVITAPAGRRVFFQISSFSFTRSNPCSSNFLEIKYRSDVTITGARFCSSFPTNSLSEKNVLVVIYKGSPSTRFSLSYRYDPATPIETTTTSTTTTTTTTTMPTTTSTTGKTTTTTTPKQTTTSTTTTTTPRTTTTTTTTRRPPVNTFFPPLTTDIPCTPWTQCTAKCGGCGTSTRRCGNDIQSIYCNTQPCQGGYCCRPFFYVVQGLCIRPYGDEQLLADRQGSLMFSEDEAGELVEVTVSKDVDVLEGSGINPKE